MLAGATGGAERARHMTRSHRGTDLAAAMEPISNEITEDRAILIEIMERLDIPVRHYKIYAGRVAERAGRLKSNGRLVRRSPLSPLLELEALRVGVEGKAAVWQTLHNLARWRNCAAARSDRRSGRRERYSRFKPRYSHWSTSRAMSSMRWAVVSALLSSVSMRPSRSRSSASARCCARRVMASSRSVPGVSTRPSV